MTAWAMVAALLACLPLGIALSNLRVFKRPVRLPPSGTTVSIIIPARNEQEHIQAAVTGALASRGVEVEVVVLDDQSTDDTASIVERMALRDARVKLVRAPALPHLWAGKQRACWLAAQHARHRVLMFIDADVHIEADAAALAAGHLLHHPRIGLVSGFPREITGSLGERLVVPWIHVMLLGYLPMTWMRRSLSPGFGAGCGQWMVARRLAYLAVDGHAAEPASRHDGTSLPRTFRRRGWMTDIFDGTDLASCRMYTRFSDVWTGFGKSAGEGMATPRGLPVWTLLIFGGHVLPWVLLVPALVSGAWAAAAWSAVGVAANLALRVLLMRRLKQDAAGVPWHPVGALLTLAINIEALTRHLRGRPSVWRGRSYAPGRRLTGQADFQPPL